MRCEEKYFKRYGRKPEAVNFFPYRISHLSAVCASIDGVDLRGGLG